MKFLRSFRFTKGKARSKQRTGDGEASIERLIGMVDKLQRSVDKLDKRVAALSSTAPAAATARAPATSAKPAAPKPAAPKPAAAPAAGVSAKSVGDPGEAPVRLLVAGLRGHGRKHIAAFAALDGCRIDCVCDIDTAIGEQVVEEVAQATGHRPRYVRDFREAIADPEIDAVSIATPHHWHALMAIWALQAGKHVYLEKPLSHNYREAESVLAAAAKYGKVVQFGTQLRSNESLRAAAEYMQAGKLGEVEVVHCLVYKPRPAVPATNENKIPTTVDYDAWCGPAPLAPVTRSKFHYHWHWLWDFGNGALGNNGIHRVDVARIGLGEMLPGIGDRVLSYGGRFGGHDSGETPNVQIAIHRFGRRWVIEEVIGLPVKPLMGVSNGIIFYGEGGRNIIYQRGAAALADEAGAVIERFEGKQASHYANFLDAVRRNDPQAVTGDLEQGHISSALCHVANISYRLGRPADDAEIAAVVDSLGAPQRVREVLGRIRATLLANGETGRFTLGETLVLDYDAADGPIVDNDRADALLGRDARPAYRIPAPAEV